MNKLSVEKMQKIEKKVQRLLPEFNVEDSPYVDIVSIVKKDGFVVHPEEMDMDTTGYLLVNDGAKKNKRYMREEGTKSKALKQFFIALSEQKEPATEDDKIFRTNTKEQIYTLF